MKKKITIYFSNEFFGNISKVEATLIEIDSSDYAQYQNAPFVSYLPKGKRKGGYIKRATYCPYIIVLEGWGHPEPADMFGAPIQKEGCASIRESLYNSFDERYKTDFDLVINPYINYEFRGEKFTRPVLMDIRETMKTTLLTPQKQSA